jgi:large subunit ribosomal protein L23
MKIKKVLVQPVVSEKSFAKAEEGIYVFRVDKNANKREIKQAVETSFDVKVDSVRTLNRKGKRIVDWATRNTSSRKDFKIAYIKLASGDSIEVFNT